jgi:hypothetical protein
MELLISGLVSVVIMEAYAWLPRLSLRLLDRAVKRLRKRDQDRCRQEWIVGLEALPNTFAKLFHAIRFVRAARKIGDASFRSEFRLLDEELREVAERRILLVERFGQAKVQLNCSGRKLAGVLDDLCSSTQDLPQEASKKRVSVLRSGETIETFSRKLFSEQCRAMQLKLFRIENADARLEHAKCRIEEASAKLDETDDAMRRGASLDQLDELLTEIAADLREVRSILADEEWGEDEAIRGCFRVCQAVGCRPERCRHSPPLAAQQPAMPMHDHLEPVSEAAD